MAAKPALGLSHLTADDLADLRLAAQIMAHRAQLSGRLSVVLYFDALEAAILAAEAARGQIGSAGPSGSLDPAPSSLSAGHEDDLLIRESLDLLANNERLPVSVRDVFSQLGAARTTRQP